MFGVWKSFQLALLLGNDTEKNCKYLQMSHTFELKLKALKHKTKAKLKQFRLA